MMTTRATLQTLLTRYLVNHTMNATMLGLSTVCECRICVDTRAALEALEAEEEPE